MSWPFEFSDFPRAPFSYQELSNQFVSQVRKPEEADRKVMTLEEAMIIIEIARSINLREYTLNIRHRERNFRA